MGGSISSDHEGDDKWLTVGENCMKKCRSESCGQGKSISVDMRCEFTAQQSWTDVEVGMGKGWPAGQIILGNLREQPELYV